MNCVNEQRVEEDRMKLVVDVPRFAFDVVAVTPVGPSGSLQGGGSFIASHIDMLMATFVEE